MEEEASSGIKISRYNSAQLKNFRLDGLWKDAQRHCQQGRYNDWNTALDLIWAELAGDVKPGSARERDFLAISKRIAECGTLSISILNGFSMPTQVEQTRRVTHYYLLLDKQIMLNRLQNEVGKGTAYKDEFEDDFE